ncbi:MAG: hypothetical protein ACPGU7_11965 [Gammaproteobacteria bacterium]
MTSRSVLFAFLLAFTAPLLAAPDRLAIVSTRDFLPPDEIRDRGDDALPPRLVARVTEKLVQSGRFTVVERQSIERLRSEKRFSARSSQHAAKAVSALVSSMDELEPLNFETGMGAAALTKIARDQDAIESLQRFAQLARADLLLIAQIEGLRQRSHSQLGLKRTNRTVEARLRLVDVRTSALVGARSIRISESSLGPRGVKAASGLEDGLASGLAMAILDMRYPATIRSTDPLVISRGQSDGVQPGQVLRVQRPGQEVKEADGTSLGRVLKDMGRARIVTVQDKISLIEPLTKSTFALGDLVQFLPPDQATGNRSASVDPNAGAIAAVSRPSQLLIAGPRLSAGVNAPPGSLRTAIKSVVKSRVSASRRLTVLDRSDLIRALDEIQLTSFLRGDDFSRKLAGYSESDAILFVDVRELERTSESRNIEVLGTTETRSSTRAVVDVNLLSPSNGQLLYSDRFTLADSRVPWSANGIGQWLGTEVSNAVIGVLLPITVISFVDDETVILNHGTDLGLRSGMNLAVMESRSIIDPQTGADLGSSPRQIATLLVQDVQSATSTAAVVHGQVRPGMTVKTPAPGFVARERAARANAPAPAPRPKLSW